jgi:hypothetical protein
MRIKNGFQQKFDNFAIQVLFRWSKIHHRLPFNRKKEGCSRFRQQAYSKNVAFYRSFYLLLGFVLALMI